MAQVLMKEELTGSEEPDISHIITEDDTPVDNIFSEKQQRLLTESLSISWNPGRPFLALANVGLFYGLHEPPLVPDMMLGLDVRPADDIWKKKNRTWFVWEFGKPPEVAVEVVSNRKGGETGEKVLKYAQAGVRYYVIFDPQRLILRENTLRIYELSPAGSYIPKLDRWLKDAGLGVKLWKGSFDGIHAIWLRWTDSGGNLIPTGSEHVRQEHMRADMERRRAEIERIRAEQEQKRAEQEQKRAEQEQKRAEQEQKRAETAEQSVSEERRRAERLAEKLRALGIDPDAI